MIIELIVFIVVFIGLISGLLLNKIAKEEIIQYRKYFKILEIIFLLTLIISLLYNINGYYWIIAFFIGLIIAFFIRELFLFLGAALILSSFNNNVFALVASLIFIFLMIFSARNRDKFKLKNIIIGFILFLLPIILLFFDEFIINNIDILLGLVAGCIVMLTYHNYKDKILFFS